MQTGLQRGRKKNSGGEKKKYGERSGPLSAKKKNPRIALRLLSALPASSSLG